MPIFSRNTQKVGIRLGTSAPSLNHERNGQQNVMQIYESAVLRRGSFPCRPATVGDIVATASWLKQAGRRVDHVQAQDAGAEKRTLGEARAMSAKPPKADIRRRDWNVREGQQ